MIRIVPYRENWQERFKDLGASLREVVGSHALAIHHIGSTSVPGLAAKDIIDVQITVADFNLPYKEGLESLGLNFRTYDHDHCLPGMELAPGELEKRYFSNDEWHVHIRILNRFNQRYALLCRDYLRTNEMAANAYAEIKHELARYFPDNVEAYYDIKDPVFDIIMAGALGWAGRVGWQQPHSDA